MITQQPTGLRQMGETPKPKPLQASTNIIHTKIARNVENIKLSLNSPTKPILNEPNRKKQTKSTRKSKSCETQSNSKSSTTQNIPPKKVDENDDVHLFVKNAYSPLNDVHQFDEKLYQKVLKLELADDGLPRFESEEPFDF